LNISSLKGTDSEEIFWSPVKHNTTKETNQKEKETQEYKDTKKHIKED